MRDPPGEEHSAIRFRQIGGIEQEGRPMKIIPNMVEGHDHDDGAP